MTLGLTGEFLCVYLVRNGRFPALSVNEECLMLGKTEGRKRRLMAEDEMVGWHH